MLDPLPFDEAVAILEIYPYRGQAGMTLQLERFEGR